MLRRVVFKQSDGKNFSRSNTIWALIACVCISLVSTVQAQPVSSIDQLLELYAETHLKFTTDQQLEEPLLQLLMEAERIRDENPNDADAWIATGRIRFAYANTQGMIGFFSLSKTSRNELQQAISLDRNAMSGFAQSMLGLLYVGLPPWPVSFGSKKKGKQMYAEALSINDADLGNNYYYGMYLAGDGQYQYAKQRLQQARSRAIAEGESAYPMQQALYLREIDELLQSIEEKLE